MKLGHEDISPLIYDQATKKLTVRGAIEFPRQILEYGSEVEILDMPDGQLSDLPDDFGRLINLKVAFFPNQSFTEIPRVLADCDSLSLVGFKSCKISDVHEDCLPTNLGGLILTDNRVAKLPRSIGKLHRLKKLMMAGNTLEGLPSEIVGCQNLELLRLPVNNLSNAPGMLQELSRLAWYTDSGNPFSIGTRVDHLRVPEIAWDEVFDKEKLSENAKNTVYRGGYGKSMVAVKVYGSALTTDGYPVDEMRANIEAGAHKNIIRVLGRLVGEPEGKQGLVMPLIPVEYQNLGLPPSFETLTRDTYSEGREFSLPFIIEVLRGMAGAMRHMHEQGVMNGDFYAHNILVNGSGESYLGDYGAASLYETSLDESQLHQRIDVRGFGYLMEELLLRCLETSANNDRTTFLKLKKLERDCLNIKVSQRPLFVEIQEMLS